MRAALVTVILAVSSVIAFPQNTPGTTKTIFITASAKDGKPVTLDQIECNVKLRSLEPVGTSPISYAIVLDTSNSGRDSFNAQLIAAKQILSEVIRPNFDRGFLKTTQDEQRVIFLLSDGEDNQSRNSFGDTVAMLVRSNIRVFPIHIGPSVAFGSRGSHGLKSIADYTGGAISELEPSRNLPDMEKVVTAIKTDLSNAYRAQLVPSPDLKKGVPYRLELRSRDRAVKLRAPTSYIVEN